MIQQAIILAGGFGTRLRTVVSEVPKPMAPVNDRPFLAYVLDHCQAHGIRKVVLAVGYLHEKVMDYFGNQYKEIELIYSIEKDALGTGGGIALAASKLDQNPFFVLNGDTLFKADLQALVAHHHKQSADMTLALCAMKNFDRYGVVETDTSHRVTQFKEKCHMEAGNINAGVYILSRSILDKSKLPEKFSFEKDFMEAFIENYHFSGRISSDYFIDIGIPEDYAKAQLDLK